MKAILPNAMFIGFTGTPLLKADKQKSIEVFGRYIHTYKFDEAVKPMNMAFGRIAFIASFRSPDWVRWHSSTKTKRFPLAAKPGGSARFNSAM
jgi:type I site-specific restriction-modification system R (restriction) subunit